MSDAVIRWRRAFPICRDALTDGRRRGEAILPKDRLGDIGIDQSEAASPERPGRRGVEQAARP
ncbi:hypothetical protein ABEX47_12275 [Paenibacillus ehimensis]|uniref:hypothetical protein n=1 Tax=Paenibacillus ehimensis TaxID=79264 RepID=UPI003D2CBBF1